MLTVYFLKPYERMEGAIEYNDGWFNMHIGTACNSDEAVKVVKDIDEVDICDSDRKYFESPFKAGALVRIDELSTGCKTALNVLNFPDKCFCMNECGNNAIDKILTFNDGAVYINRYPGLNRYGTYPLKMVWNGKEFVANSFIEAIDIVYSNINDVY